MVALTGGEPPRQDLVRALVESLVRASAADRAFLEAVGQQLALAHPSDTLAGFLETHERLGLGELRPVFATADRYEFVAHGISREGTSGALCAFTQGFLSGALASLTNGSIVGTETLCQARHDPVCRFVLVARRR